jgi:ribonuclease D
MMKAFGTAIPTVVTGAALVFGAAAVASFVHLRYRFEQFFRIQRKKCEQLIHSKGLKILMIESRNDWTKIPPSFFMSVEKSKIVGLDCEWVAEDTKEPVALLQISSHSGECVLIRLCKVKNILPKIQKILENEEIIKVGVGIKGDALRLRQISGVAVRGSLDLRHLVSIRQGQEKFKKSLAGLSAKFLNITLEKDLQIICSDWEAPRLNNRQIDYASLDAFVSVPIFCELVNDFYQLSIKKRFFPVTASESWAIARKTVKPYLDKQDNRTWTNCKFFKQGHCKLGPKCPYNH